MSGAAQAADPRPADPPRPAWRSPMAVSLFLLIAALGVFADLASKHVVFQSLLQDPQLPARAQLVRQRYTEGPDGQPISPRDVLRVLQVQRPLCCGVRLTLSTNRGVVFGWYLPPWAVVIATGVTICLVGLFFAMSHARSFVGHGGLALIVAGAIGNLYDRLLGHVQVPGAGVIRNEVRDFIDCSEISLFGWNYPYIFNVADILLVIGVVVLILHSWLSKHPIGRLRLESHPEGH